MAAQTILFDFTVDKERTGDAKERQEIAKLLRHELEHIFPQLEMAFQMPMDDGYFAVWAENKETFITVRIFPQGLVTINVEYYLEDGKEQLMSFDTMRAMELILQQKLNSDRSKYLPPIKRGGYIDIYMTSSVYNEKICKLEEDVIENESEDDYFVNYDPLDSLQIEIKEELPKIENEEKEDEDDIPLIQRKKTKKKKRKKPQEKTEPKAKDSSSKANEQMPITTDDNKTDKRISKKRDCRKHQCGVCEKIFQFQSELVDHVQTLHPNENGYKCKDCSESFASIKLLYRHRQIHRKSLKAHLCEFCSKAFNLKDHLARHLRVHTNERPYACDVCGNAYKESKDLRLHKMTHTNELPVSCEVCGKGFKENKTLKLHLLKSHSVGKANERPYSCSLCGRTFKEHKDLMLHHQKTHMQPIYDFGVSLFK